MQEVWKKVLEQLRSQLSKPTFEMWFKHTQIKSWNDKHLIVSVPSEFTKDWLQTRYASLITSALQSVTNETYEITYHIEEEEKEKVKSKTQEKDYIHKTKELFYSMQLNDRYVFENFIIGESNRLAFAGCKSIADSPGSTYNPLFIYGGVGLGKTHLLQAVAHSALSNGCKKVIYTTSEKFTNEVIFSIQERKMREFHDFYRSVDFLIIDDIQFLAGKERTQEEFFHTFNTLYDAKKQIALSSDRPPKDLSDIAERLRTRFQMGLMVDVQAPDYETRVAILRKKAGLEELDVPDEVLDFIANQPFTNIRELEGTLIRLLAYASLNNIEISINLAKEVLKDVVTLSNKVITAEDIKEVVSSYFNITSQDMETKKRSQDISTPRQIAIYLIRTLTDYSLPMIGRFFGGRDHSTIIHSYEKIKKELEVSEALKAAISEIITKLKYKQ